VIAVGGNSTFGLLGTISAAARWSRMALRNAQSAHDKQEITVVRSGFEQKCVRRTCAANAKLSEGKAH
jgi:hypothetical protein